MADLEDLLTFFSLLLSTVTYAVFAAAFLLMLLHLAAQIDPHSQTWIIWLRKYLIWGICALVLAQVLDMGYKGAMLKHEDEEDWVQVEYDYYHY